MFLLLEKKDIQYLDPNQVMVGVKLDIQINDKKDFRLPSLKPKGQGLNGFNVEAVSVVEKEDLGDVSGNVSSRALRHQISKSVSEGDELKKRDSSKSLRSVKKEVTRKSTSRSSRSRGVCSGIMDRGRSCSFLITGG
jgi:hypothetical protein